VVIVHGQIPTRSTAGQRPKRNVEAHRRSSTAAISRTIADAGSSSAEGRKADVVVIVQTERTGGTGAQDDHGHGEHEEEGSAAPSAAFGGGDSGGGGTEEDKGGRRLWLLRLAMFALWFLGMREVLGRNHFHLLYKW